MGKTVAILPETDEKTLFVRLSDVVALADYMEFFDKPVKAIAYEHGTYNLCVFHDASFKGWTEEAAKASFECIGEIGSRARRLAYVNTSDSRRLMMKMLSPLVGVEIRYFELGEEEEATSWMRSVPD